MTNDPASLETVLENVASPLAVFDAGWRFVYANRAAAELLGRNPQELPGKRLWDEFPEALDTPLHPNLLRAARERAPVEFVTPWPPSVRVFEVRATPWQDGLIVQAQDATARQEAEEARARAEVALRASEARLRFLDELGEATRALADPADVMAVVTESLGRFLSASRCAYAEVEADADRFTIPYDWTDGCASTAGTYSLDLFGPRAAEDMRQGRTLVVRDVDGELAPGGGAEMFNAIGIKAVVCCPLVKGGRLAAMMAVHQSAPRDWTGAEIRLVEAVVERSWSTIERARAARELARSEARFRAAQETSVDGFMVLDSVRDAAGSLVDFRWAYANEAAARIVGRPREWFVGKRLLEEMPGNREEGLFDAYARVAETGEPWTREFRYAHEGVNAYIRSVAARVGDGFAVTFADLTARQQAEDAVRESEARFRQLADSMPQIVWTARPDGYLDYYNERWYDFTGLPRGEGGDSSWDPILHPDDVSLCYETWYASVRSGEPYQIAYRFKDRRAGGYRWFLGRALPVRDAAGRVVKWFGTCTDIDDNKRAERALLGHQAEIEALNARLQNAMRETHHRVKNNLQVISALLEMQVMEGGESVPSREVRRIMHHVGTLASLHDLLTQQAKGDADLGAVSLRAVFDRLLSMLRGTVGDRTIRADVRDAPLPVGKAAALALLVNELVSNAVKHGRGEVELTFGAENGVARLEVCDDGPGFPPGFDPRKSANTGLELIETAARLDLRGDVRYENRAKGGGRVSVVFPLSQPDGADG